MATLPDINSHYKLKAWLQDKPPEWAQVIASRAALRALPRVGRVFAALDERVTLQQKVDLVFSIFRANLTSEIAARRPIIEIAIAGDAAAIAAAVAANSLYAISNKDPNVDYSSAAHATAAANYANDPNNLTSAAAYAGANPVIWEEVSDDALWLTNRLQKLTGAPYQLSMAKEHALTMVPELSALKLWSVDQPEWVKSELFGLASHLAVRGGDWTHWIDWYRARLHGRPFGLHPQLAGKLRDDFDYRVATQPDEWWARGPEAVNADIARWIAEETAKLAARNEGDDPEADDSNDFDDPDDLTRIYELGPEVDSDWDPYEPQDDGEDAAALERAAELIGALEQSRAGLPIEVGGDELRIGATGADGDLEAAANRLTRQLHGEVIPLAREFAALAMRLDNRHGWTGIGRAASRLADFLAQGPEAVAENIGLVWVDSVRLGSFLEQDTAILAGKSEIADPLVAEDRRKLSDLVTVAAPYVRRYPSARELDVESRAFKASDTLIAEGRDLIAAAQQTGLLNKQDGKTIEAIFDTAGHGGVQGQKAGAVAVETARNVVFKAGAVVATCYVGAVLGAAAPHSVLVSRGVETFLTSEKAIIELVKDMPDDIGIAYRILLDGMKDPSILPSRPRPARRPEDEKRQKDE